MKIALLTIIVGNQDHALSVYRDKLGFIVIDDQPTGPPGAPRWITLESPDAPGGARISLEPNMMPFVKTYQDSLKQNGVPLTAFAVDDVQAEYDRLTALGLSFKSPPIAGDAAMPAMATFDDQCGNWITLYQEPQA